MILYKYGLYVFLEYWRKKKKAEKWAIVSREGSCEFHWFSETEWSKMRKLYEEGFYFVLIDFLKAPFSPHCSPLARWW